METGPVGVVAVLRGPDAKRLVAEGELLAELGIKFIEVAMSTSAAAEVMRGLNGRISATVGAGTVLSRHQAEAAIKAGARFIVSPASRIRVLEVAKEHGLACVLGGWTATEVAAGWEAGASQIKVYPIGLTGGPNYLKSLHSIYPEVRMMASGGIALDRVGDYRMPHVESIALGSELVGGLDRAFSSDEVAARVREALDRWPYEASPLAVEHASAEHRLASRD